MTPKRVVFKLQVLEKKFFEQKNPAYLCRLGPQNNVRKFFKNNFDQICHDFHLLLWI